MIKYYNNNFINMDNPNFQNGIKVILLGESGVGKTSLINVSVDFDFNENIESTYYNSFVRKCLKINNEKYVINLWDTIGQEKFRSLTKLFFKDSKIVILVYDKANKKSFEELNYWNDEVKKILGDDDDKYIKAVVGNKEDLDEEEVDENEAREFAKRIKAKFTMASAKKNEKGFVNFLEDLLDNYITKNKGKLNENKDKIILNSDSQRKNRCCK